MPGRSGGTVVRGLGRECQHPFNIQQQGLYADVVLYHTLFAQAGLLGRLVITGPRGVQHGDNPLPVTQMILTTKLPAAADTLTLKEQLRLAAALFG